MSDEEFECSECDFTSTSQRGVSIHHSRTHNEDFSARISDDELVEGLKELERGLGRTPTEEEMTEHGRYCAETYRSRFGSWPAAVREAGFDPVHHVTDEQLLDALEDLADEIGRTPTGRQMLDRGRYSGKVYRQRFGSWNEAVLLAGLEPTVWRNISDEDLIGALVSLTDEIGRTPRGSDMRERGKYCRKVYEKRFGSWNAALLEAGLKINQLSDVPKEDLLAELRRLADELGRRPTTEEMNADGKFWHGSYVHKFGTWNDALAEIGYEPYEVPTGEDHWLYGVGGEDHPLWDGGYEPSYGPGWNETKKEAVRERDGRTCQNCGRSEASHIEEFGRKQSVHHIMKVRKFDDREEGNAMENLVTLCQTKECHKKWEKMSPLRPVVSD